MQRLAEHQVNRDIDTSQKYKLLNAQRYCVPMQLHPACPLLVLIGSLTPLPAGLSLFLWSTPLLYGHGERRKHRMASDPRKGSMLKWNQQLPPLSFLVWELQQWKSERLFSRGTARVHTHKILTVTRNSKFS